MTRWRVVGVRRMMMGEERNCQGPFHCRSCRIYHGIGLWCAISWAPWYDDPGGEREGPEGQVRKRGSFFFSMSRNGRSFCFCWGDGIGIGRWENRTVKNGNPTWNSPCSIPQFSIEVPPVLGMCTKTAVSIHCAGERRCELRE